MVSINESIIVSGGYQYDFRHVSTVAEFKDNLWNQLGNLNQARLGHNSIIFDSEILIVGGSGTFASEVWNFEDNKSTSIDPTLTSYDRYPALFHVPFDFCL